MDLFCREKVRMVRFPKAGPRTPGEAEPQGEYVPSGDPPPATAKTHIRLFRDADSTGSLPGTRESLHPWTEGSGRSGSLLPGNASAGIKNVALRPKEASTLSRSGKQKPIRSLKKQMGFACPLHASGRRTPRFMKNGLNMTIKTTKYDKYEKMYDKM